jgi:hypothetical protein
MLPPALFVAATVNVYGTPSVSPVIVSGHDAPVALAPPGEATAVYEVIGAPPSLAGGLQPIVAEPSDVEMEVIVGWPGGAAGVTAFDAEDADPVPRLFVAVTANV